MPADWRQGRSTGIMPSDWRQGYSTGIMGSISMKPIRVYLWAVPNPVIIVPGATNIIYCNQVNGVATEHRELEGYLIPLPKTDDEIFKARWWERHCNRRAPDDPRERWERLADDVERALSNIVSSGETPTEMRVDRDQENVEAWFHIAFEFSADATSGALDTHRLTGVLTWENCD